MDIYYGKLENLNWLWLVMAIGVIVGVALWLQRKTHLKFATADMLKRIRPAGQRWQRSGSIVLTLLALAAIVVGLADIRWGKTSREVPQKGIEIMFALDVSRSMLAEDVAPSRLERAKQDIKDMVNEMAGDRVGLVIFAGDVKQQIPLTNHYEDFKQRLDSVDTQLIETGGSNLGQAITAASDSFLEKTHNHKAIVLITDGEDHESKPVEQAKKAFAENGVKIFTVGLGDMKRGAKIPVPTRRGTSFVQHDGETVWSKLDGRTLEQIAVATDGAYIPAGTKRVDMAAVYHRFIAGIAQQNFETAKIEAYVPRYHWFLGTALGLLMLDIFISTLTTQKKRVDIRPFDEPTLFQRKAA